MALEWGAESLRVSLFSNAPTSVNDEDWRALSSQTEQYNRQTTLGGLIFSGNIDGGQLNLSGINKRVDIILTTIPPTTPVSEGRLPTIGQWEAARDRFSSFTSAWIETAKFPIVRVAFGAVLLCPTASRHESYTVLKRLLTSVSVDPDKMRELLFRINWPTTSKIIDGLLINRITNWSAIEFLLANVELGASPSATASTQGHAVRLEIDHSTDLARSKPFAHGQVLSIYKELISTASDNANKGECR
jgi:hypothetical protein